MWYVVCVADCVLGAFEESFTKFYSGSNEKTVEDVGEVEGTYRLEGNMH